MRSSATPSTPAQAAPVPPHYCRASPCLPSVALPCSRLNPPPPPATGPAQIVRATAWHGHSREPGRSSIPSPQTSSTPDSPVARRPPSSIHFPDIPPPSPPIGPMSRSDIRARHACPQSPPTMLPSFPSSHSTICIKLRLGGPRSDAYHRAVRDAIIARSMISFAARQ